MTDHDAIDLEVLLSQFKPPEMAVQAQSFGGVASHYERYRPGPPDAAIDWILPEHVGRIVDLGAGTGASTRPLIDRADEVVAVEPDDRMRSILRQEVGGVEVVKGQGESMPLPDHCADAVLASSSWHWMDRDRTLREVGRVLVPGGVLGALWSVPDPDGAFLVQVQSLLSGSPGGGTGGTGRTGRTGRGMSEVDGAQREISSFILGNAYRSSMTLEIPPGAPFDEPAHQVFTWDVALNADELIGLLGTWPWIITLPEETRARVFAEARRLLRELLGIEGHVTADVGFRSEVWRCHRSD
ncbi:MAG: class I SAM-dependent methyltransferase [Acidimicrobiales bacterium]